MDDNKISVDLNEREARLALDAITRQSTTVEIVQAQIRQAHLMGETAQKRLDDTLEAVLAMHDIDLPRSYSVRITGTTLELLKHPEPIEHHGVTSDTEIAAV
jgi:hypothetical protein